MGEGFVLCPGRKLAKLGCAAVPNPRFVRVLSLGLSSRLNWRRCWSYVRDCLHEWVMKSTTLQRQMLFWDSGGDNVRAFRVMTIWTFSNQFATFLSRTQLECTTRLVNPTATYHESKDIIQGSYILSTLYKR